MIEKYVYHFAADNEPVKTVDKGSTVSFKTLDCFSGQIKKEEDLVTGIDFDRVNPATGPVFINGAEPGDILVVDIEKIDVADAGVASLLPGTGPLIDTVEGVRTKVIPIVDNKVIFNDIEYPANPMVGVIGVAPKEGKISCGLPGNYGGNMDCNKITKGSRVYFPVQVPGALFQLGDLHASMGDGEICGTGIEIPGEVTVKLDLVKDTALDWPVVETEDMWYAIASDPSIELASKYAAEQIQLLVSKAYDWDMADVYLYMSINGSLETCQVCRPSDFPAVMRFGVPKLESKPRLLP